ncbi:MAG: hypothetical protein HOA57_02250 [Candidatus Magasanikbacteria bacterium]|jgi:hypothetical protein|nr:hypothetical protein [Candidatus Magasanikbacteria bacterium]MBT4314954.1 hypothetical protein [Candidatus Magasanikbacteria bacterium]MBT4546910.1 hypothetical protein [Candidatus Magasanikbacteria bacterium]MBT6819176.1 hypothetical protein [Candidatus Magasanikbacteria bacterium]
MNFFQKQIKIIGLLSVLILLFFNLNFWSYSWLGWILFASYLLLVGEYWQMVYRKVLWLSRRLWMTRIFSYLSVFLLLSFISSVFIVFDRLSLSLVWFTYAVTTVLSLVIFYFVQNSKRKKPVLLDVRDENLVIFKKTFVLPITYFILWVIGFYFLYISKSSEILRSPWQAISEYYLLIFFVLTLFSGIFLFSKYKTKTILFIFLFQSILLHLYIPMSHQMPWGGDVWRHLANEKILMQEEQILPVLVGEDAQWVEVAGVDIPEVLTKPHKYTYGQLWGGSVLLSQTLQVDLLVVNRWLVPILWSMCMPFILFRLGWILFGSVRRGLWLPWFMFLAFPFQAWGGLTLPVSLGFITFLFALMLWLQYLRDGNKTQRNLTLFFAVLMLFGYSLYFILIWLAILFSIIIKYFPKASIPKNISKYSLLFLSIFIFPIIEIVSKISFIPDSIEWWFGLKQIIGRFTGFFYAQMIRPHDILGGNVLFNHTPDYAFVSNIFNTWRWWLIPFMIIMVGLSKFGVFKILKKKNKIHLLILFLTSTVVGGYVIGWFILAGDKLFTRRLELMFSFLWIVLIVYVLQRSLVRWRARDLFVRIGTVVCLIIFSWFGTFVYASGLDDRVISVNEYEVAQKVWVEKPGCVLGDTWFLLALEGVSSGEIVGGGFPIDYQFGQTERVDMFNKFAKYPAVEDLHRMKGLTGGGKCVVVYEDYLDIEIVSRINEIMDSEVQKVDGLLVWEEGLKNLEK